MESLNAKVRLIARRALGFHSASALIAQLELALSALYPSLPAENHGERTHGYASRSVTPMLWSWRPSLALITQSSEAPQK